LYSFSLSSFSLAIYINGVVAAVLAVIEASVIASTCPVRRKTQNIHRIRILKQDG